jgi:hypothetical protein
MGLSSFIMGSNGSLGPFNDGPRTGHQPPYPQSPMSSAAAATGQVVGMWGTTAQSVGPSCCPWHWANQLAPSQHG